MSLKVPETPMIRKQADILARTEAALCIVSAVVAVTGSGRVGSAPGDEMLLSLWVSEAFQKVFWKLCVGSEEKENIKMCFQE